MRYCSIMHAASYASSFLRNYANSLAISGTYRFLTVLLELLLVIGKMAFLNSLFNLRIFLSLENLPNHDGNCGKPKLQLIFSVGQTHVMNPKDGMRPHSCCFLIVRSKTSPKVMPRMPYTNLWKSWGFNGVLAADDSRFSWTMMGTISLSTKKHSVLCCIFIPENSARFSSFLAASKWLIMTLLSFALRLRAERASTVILRDTVRKMTCRARSQPVPPSAIKISLSLRTRSDLLGLWNFTSIQCAARDRIFSLLLSLQMQMTGTLVCLSMLMMAATPPRSPVLIPSTQSIIISGLVRLWKRSRLQEPLQSRVTPDLFLTSLALNSVTEQLYSMASSRAVVVLPMPGSPLSSAPAELMFPPAFQPFDYLTSRLLPLMWMSYQLQSHYLRERIWLFYPITQSRREGLYFYVQSLQSWGGFNLYMSMGYSSYPLRWFCTGLLMNEMGFLATAFLLMWSSRVAPVFSKKKSSIQLKGMILIPFSLASLLLLVSYIGCGNLLLKWSSTCEPCRSRLHFLVIDFGHQAPSCSQTYMILSLSQPSQPPVKAMTMPAKGPVLPYFGIDFALFTYFFTSDLIYLVGSRSGLGGDGCLTGPLLPFMLGLSYQYAQSSKFQCLLVVAVRLSLMAISINFCSSCISPLYYSHFLACLTQGHSDYISLSLCFIGISWDFCCCGFFYCCYFFNRNASPSVSCTLGLSFSLSLPYFLVTYRSFSFYMKRSRRLDDEALLATLPLMSDSAASRRPPARGYFDLALSSCSSQGQLMRYGFSSSPEGSSISSWMFTSLIFLRRRLWLLSGGVQGRRCVESSWGGGGLEWCDEEVLVPFLDMGWYGMALDYYLQSGDSLPFENNERAM